MNIRNSYKDLLFKLLDMDHPDNNEDIAGYFMEFLTLRDKQVLLCVSKDIHGSLSEPARYRYARKGFNAKKLIVEYKNAANHFLLNYGDYKFCVVNKRYSDVLYRVVLFPFLLLESAIDMTALMGHAVVSGVKGGVGFFKGAVKDYTEQPQPKPRMRLALTLKEQAAEKEKKDTVLRR